MSIIKNTNSSKSSPAAGYISVASTKFNVSTPDGVVQIAIGSGDVTDRAGNIGIPVSPAQVTLNKSDARTQLEALAPILAESLAPMPVQLVNLDQLESDVADIAGLTEEQFNAVLKLFGDFNANPQAMFYPVVKKDENPLDSMNPALAALVGSQPEKAEEAIPAATAPVVTPESLLQNLKSSPAPWDTQAPQVLPSEQ